MNQEYAIQIVWSTEDGAYIAFAAELPGCLADGSTPEEALANIRVVIQEWIETAKEEGREIPPPLTVEDFSRVQQQAQGQLRQYVENEVKNAVNAVLSQIATMHPPSSLLGMRSGVSVTNLEGVYFGPGLVSHESEG